MSFLRLLSALALLFSIPSQGAEVRVDSSIPNQNTVIVIQGEIQPGDYEKFQRMLVQGGSEAVFALFTKVLLNSPGGDVVEAMKFANLFDRGNVSVSVAGHCYSACVIMFAGAASRSLIALSDLGLHRMTLRGREPDLQQAKSLIPPLSADISSYLLKQGFPRLLVDKMTETPAAQLYRVDHHSLYDAGWGTALDFSPIVADMIDKECGTDPAPFPGKFIAEARRTDEVMRSIAARVKCTDKLLWRNRTKFITQELRLAKENRPSILFPRGSGDAVWDALPVFR